MKRSSKLKNLINSDHLEFILEAHNGLCAKIVEEAGFKGIWASGLTISASAGVRDCNELTWTQILDILEFMSDAVSIPILLDGDTGYGDFNNVRRLVRKLEQRSIAGLCLEDKLFPKTNSLIEGAEQRLAEIGDFCGKIKAAKDTQVDEDFVIVARTEAFIAGLGLAEVLCRADAYRQAGADAILVYSKRNDPEEIIGFMKEWGGRHPVVIIPTTYSSTPIDLFRRIGISMVIWANQNLRSVITAIRQTSMELMESKDLSRIEERIAPISEVFRLQGVDELEAAKKKYLLQPF